jgi:hypothetical protein
VRVPHRGGGLAQRRHRGDHGGHPRGARLADGLHEARGTGPGGVHGDARVRQRGQREAGQRRHAEAGPHEPEHRQVVVRREVHPRGEPGPGAGAHQLGAALRAAGDPRAVGQPGEVDRLPGGAPVGPGQHDHHVVPQQGDAPQPVVVRRERVRSCVAERHGDVHPARGELGQRLRRLRLHERDAHPRVGGPQRGERRREQRGRGRGERGDPEASGAQAGDRGDLLQGRVQRGLHGRGVAGEHLTGLGQPHSATGAHDDRRADQPLDGAQLLARRGLGQPELPRGGGDAPGVLDGADEAQRRGVEAPGDHAASISARHASMRNRPLLA